MARRSKPRMIPACLPHAETPLTAGKPAGGQKHRWLSGQGLHGGALHGTDNGPV